jgi:hypothetical protein
MRGQIKNSCSKGFAEYVIFKEGALKMLRNIDLIALETIVFILETFRNEYNIRKANLFNMPVNLHTFFEGGGR